jgi:1-acyl-sn-glycerol-3-phosphate acyltransferase
MGKAELFRVPLIGRLFWTLGGFPVRRGEADRHAMGEAIRRLQEGRVVAMFPEGTRSRDGRLGRGKPGIGMIVAHSGAKVVPVYVRGTQEWYRFPRITIRFGPAVDFAPAIRQIGEEKRGVVYERMAQRIMEAIEKLA